MRTKKHVAPPTRPSAASPARAMPVAGRKRKNPQAEARPTTEAAESPPTRGSSERSLEADVAAPPIDRLPEELISRILESLGLEAAAKARLVCRRWRDAAEAILWRRLEVVGRRPSSKIDVADRIAKLLVGAGEGRRWIRLAPGASLNTRLLLKAKGDGDAFSGSPSLESLISACTMASGGLGGLDVRLRECMQCVPIVLHSFDPPAAPAAAVPAACRALRRLSIRNTYRGTLDGEMLLSFFRLHADFWGLLRHFPSLECLEIDEGAAPGLEAARDAAPLIEALASSATAPHTLKELRVRALLSGRALRALPRLAALEHLHVFYGLHPGVEGKDLAALGACPALRSLGPLDVCHRSRIEPGRIAGRLDGLAAALGRSPSLSDLELCFHVPPAAELLAKLAALGQSFPGRISLDVAVDLAPGRAAEAAAALAAARPRRLALVPSVGEDAVEDLSGLVDELGRLSAFAGCAIESTEVRLRVDPRGVLLFRFGDEGGVYAERGAARAAAAAALPSARVSFWGPGGKSEEEEEEEEEDLSTEEFLEGLGMGMVDEYFADRHLHPYYGRR
eukprot:tig00000293_g23881.t1